MRADVYALVNDYTQPLGFRPHLTCTGPIDTAVPDDARPQILATLRESLSNVVRHAQASDVRVDLTVTGQGVTLRVADNGIGISAAGRRSGLQNLEDRATAVGGINRGHTEPPARYGGRTSRPAVNHQTSRNPGRGKDVYFGWVDWKAGITCRAKRRIWSISSSTVVPTNRVAQKCSSPASR